MCIHIIQEFHSVVDACMVLYTFTCSYTACILDRKTLDMNHLFEQYALINISLVTANGTGSRCTKRVQEKLEAPFLVHILHAESLIRRARMIVLIHSQAIFVVAIQIVVICSSPDFNTRSVMSYLSSVYRSELTKWHYIRKKSHTS